MKTFSVGGVEYGPNEVLQLREELGLVRSEAMDRNDFDTTVVISHAIGVLFFLAELLREGDNG